MYDAIANRGMPRAYHESAFDERYTTIRFDNAVTAAGRLGNGRRIDALAAHNRYVRFSNLWYRDLTTLSEQLVDAAAEQDTSGSRSPTCGPPSHKRGIAPGSTMKWAST
ncbi:MAG: hypothetical protein H6592_01320 [Flavobacteriales bacterium]|nr:hypothetical protein [Flavobacteriales bacterium]